MESVRMTEISNDLTAIEEDCWRRLVNGALQSRDVFHHPVVANVYNYGINMRTVVLRKACPTQKQLAFFTDIRSGKWQELEQNNNISWLFYDAGDRIQIRVSGFANLHHLDELSDKAWESNPVRSRKNYLSVLAPATEIAHPENSFPGEPLQTDPTAEQSEAGRKNFGVVITQIKWMEWLWLDYKGHRKAGFIYNEDGSVTPKWWIP